MKKIENAFSWLGVVLIKAIADCLPAPAAGRLGACLGEAGFLFSSRHRKIALENLDNALGGRMDGRSLARIARRSFVNMGAGFFELLSLVRMGPAGLKELVSVEGAENLKAALAGGRGVIGFSAHLGNFCFIGPRLALAGYGFNYVFRFPDLEALARIISGIAARSGVGLIPAKPRTDTVRKSLRHLRSNEIVCILGDQHEIEGIQVDFFGAPALAAAGPVVLALRTGAAIVPIFARRLERGKHRVIIEPEFRLKVSGIYDRDVRVNTQRLANILEACILEEPSQWWWLHKRWKTAGREYN